MYILDKKSLEFFNNFKFKNLKSFNTHDGIAYSCELYHNGTEIGLVRNDGRGGMTDIHYSENGESYFSTLGVDKYQPKNLGFKVDNEFLISDLIEVAINIKKSLSKQSKSIVFMKGENIYMSGYNMTLSDIVKRNKEFLTNEIQKVEKDGGIILNTNLTKIGI